MYMNLSRQLIGAFHRSDVLVLVKRMTTGLRELGMNDAVFDLNLLIVFSPGSEQLIKEVEVAAVIFYPGIPGFGHGAPDAGYGY